jgi:multidrug efflux pump
MEFQWLVLYLISQAGANNIAIADEFYKRLEQIKKTLPADIKTGIGFDVTTFIRESIKEVEQTILVAFALSCDDYIFISA